MAGDLGDGDATTGKLRVAVHRLRERIASGAHSLATRPEAAAMVLSLAKVARARRVRRVAFVASGDWFGPSSDTVGDHLPLVDCTTRQAAREAARAEGEAAAIQALRGA